MLGKTANLYNPYDLCNRLLLRFGETTFASESSVVSTVVVVIAASEDAEDTPLRVDLRLLLLLQNEGKYNIYTWHGLYVFYTFAKSNASHVQ